MRKIKRALLSVSNKNKIIDFAKGLEKLGIEIISTGGTAKALKDAGIKVTSISEVTGFPEILDGRVKTLHPKVHGGLLAVREDPEHQKQLKELNIEPIDLVAINLYPFKDVIKKDDVTFDEAMENIDIGGPTMLRSAAKNHENVIAIVDPEDYKNILKMLETHGDIGKNIRRKLALKVFEHTANYDAIISDYLRKQIGENRDFPKNLTLGYEKVQDLRYGENPHQKAAFYREYDADKTTLAGAKQLHGKELSFNNLNDAEGALNAVLEFKVPAAVGVKHTNPCGVACGEDIFEAYVKAYEADPVSIFGGIVALNRTVDERTAKKLVEIFLEIVIAPGYDPNALEILKTKKNLRILEMDFKQRSKQNWDMKKVSGGLLVQEPDVQDIDINDLEVVTDRAPSKKELDDLMFGWKVVKHVKSNAIVLAKDKVTVGIGAGQVNRIWPTEQSIIQAGEKAKGSVLASDAFFPFSDVVEAAAKAGVTAIIQPGGSIRDKDSIKAANENDIAMVFTGMRHFRH